MTLRSLAIASLTLALAGCGGGDGGGSGGGGGGTHPLNEAVVVDHADSSTEGNPKTKLAITVKAVRKGTQADLEQGGFNLDADQKTATPYYVDLLVENRGPNDMAHSPGVSLEDGDGESISSTTVIDLGGKPFEPCPQPKSRPLEQGQSRDSCELFLVPEGRTPEKVSFLPYDPKTPTEFVFWDAK